MLASLTLLLLSASAYAQNATQCTTFKPIFGVPNDGTSTTYQGTTTLTSGLDCRGCALTSSTFTVILPTSSSNITITSPLSTTTSFECLPTTSTTASTTVSVSATSTFSPTASPLPMLKFRAAETIINKLETTILYASLIASGGFLDQLCAAINPAGFSSITNITGTAIQSEVCAAADLQLVLPSFATLVVAENAQAVGPIGFLTTALYAVQLVAGFAGAIASDADIAKLCPQIETTLINNLGIGFVSGLGDAVKTFVCSGGNST